MTGELYCNKLWIESGTGDLRSIRGKGTSTPVYGIYGGVWNYEFEILINP
jgi:hypothetical protein